VFAAIHTDIHTYMTHTCICAYVKKIYKTQIKKQKITHYVLWPDNNDLNKWVFKSLKQSKLVSVCQSVVWRTFHIPQMRAGNREIFFAETALHPLFVY